MAGARPSSFKQSGGFLNNVDATIVGYEFTTTPSFFENSKGKKKKKGSDFTPLYAELTVRVDGADDDETTTLFVGGADDFEIENDGHTLVPVDEENGALRANADWSRFIGSLVEAGFPETNLPEDEINYEPIIGARVRLKQEKDVDATARLGKKKSKDGKKEYDRTWLKVTNVYSFGEDGGTSAKPAAGKSAPAGKSTGKAAKGDDLETLAKETLKGILVDADGTVMKSKLPIKIAQKLGNKHPQREEVRKLIYSDDFLNQQDGWTYDASSKKQEITLDE